MAHENLSGNALPEKKVQETNLHFIKIPPRPPAYSTLVLGRFRFN